MKERSLLPGRLGVAIPSTEQFAELTVLFSLMTMVFPIVGAVATPHTCCRAVVQRANAKVKERI